MKNQHKKSAVMKRQEARNFYLYTAPWLVGFLVLTVYPVIYSFVLIFTNAGFNGAGKFIGLENWKYAFTMDPVFLKAFGNTVKYVVIFVPSSIALAFFTALLLNRKVMFLGFFRTVFYLP